MSFFRFLLVFAFSFTFSLSAQAELFDCQKLKPIAGEINGETFISLNNDATDCLDAGYKTVLRISSEGGDAEYSFGAFDLLTEHPNRKLLTTIAYGNVASAAVIIFLAGNERLMSCNSTLFLHEPYHTLESGSRSIDNLKHLMEEVTRIFNTMVKIHTKETGLSEEKMKALFRANTSLSAREAIKLGFATGTTKKCN